jgi:RNA recognition motif-containing protein
MNLYVGNLSYRLTEDELRQAFEEFGQVSSCTIIKDKVTGESKGFGFLEMAERSEAEAAINGLNGRDLKGRKLNVNEARPRTEGGGGGGGGRSGGGGGGMGRGSREGGGGGGGRGRW